MKALFLSLIISLSFGLHAQKLQANVKYRISNFIGLDSTRTAFEIEKMDVLGRAGYLLDLQENGQFSTYGYAFCGVGLKTYLFGTYQIKGDQLILNFNRQEYREMGQETRIETKKFTHKFRYDSSKGILERI